MVIYITLALEYCDNNKHCYKEQNKLKRNKVAVKNVMHWLTGIQPCVWVMERG